MSEDERVKWDERYRTGAYRARTWPSPFLERWLPFVPKGRALDLGCGTGRNAIRLAQGGWNVTAVDISSVAVDEARSRAETAGVEVEWLVADLDEFSAEPETYAAITMFRYINRALFPRLPALLMPGGWLLAEHHFQAEVDVEGPSDPAFRLRPRELLDVFGGLRVVDFEEFVDVDRDGGRYALQRFAGARVTPGW